MDTSMLLPAYGTRSLAEVLPAALRALGVPEPAPTAGALTLDPARAIAVLLIDGLGEELLRTHARDAPFLASLPDLGPLTVGFPSSTPVSLGSLGTGTPPGTHGLLGVTFRVGSRPAELIDCLHWTTHGTGKASDLRKRYVPEDVQPLPTAFQRAEEAGVAVTVVTKQIFNDSGLTRAALRSNGFRGTFGAGDMAAAVCAALTGPGKRLCYGYYADLDAMGHLYGTDKLAWRIQLSMVDRMVARIVEHVPPDTTVLVTGDHGMVTVTETFDADTDPGLRDGVALIGGDPRARHVYAEPGKQAEVLANWRRVLGDHAWVVPRDQAIADGWFGPVAPEMRDRIGDVVVAAKGTAAVVRSVAEPRLSQLPGQHGSFTAAEQLVPLLAART